MGIKCSYSTMNTDISFVNPYNFVDIDFSKNATDDINKIKDTRPEERLTGKIHCIITAKTPIAVPDTEKEQPENAHKRYDFMAYPDGRYFIPASSIRGTIRSVFETATDSCFSTTKDNTMLDERLAPTKGAMVNAGVLVRQENGEWALYKAKRYMLRARRGDNKNGLNPKAWDDDICPAYEPQESDKGRFIKIRKGKEYDGDEVKLRDGDEVRFERLEDSNGEDTYYKTQKKRDKKPRKCAPIATKIYSADVLGADVGYLVIGEPISGKHHLSIFKVDIKTEKPINYSANDIAWAFQGLKRTLDLYNDKAINRNLDPPEKNKELRHYGYAAFERMETKGIIPVWYIDESEISTEITTSENSSSERSKIYFMMANIGRRAFYKTLNEHLDKKVRCTKRSDLCDACRLFGVASSIGNSVGSRIRFTDALCMTEELIDNEYTMLAELGRPRTSYMPFYSSGSKSYYEKRTVPGYDTDGVTIRGRKYYWHSTNFDQINNNPDKPIKSSERNATMQLAKTGAKFEFDIFFDEILKPELEQLVWSINFFENEEDGIMCHKIGRGKPIGLGSVKIYIKSIQRRMFEENDTGQKTYVIEPYGIDYADSPYKDEIPDRVKQLTTIVNFNNCQDVSYPYVEPENDALRIKVKNAKDENALANHQWFTENKRGEVLEENHEQAHSHKLQFLEKIPISGGVENQKLYVYMAKEVSYQRQNRGHESNNQGAKTQRNASNIIWIGPYKLDDEQKKRAVNDKYVQYIRELPNKDNIKNNAGLNKTVLLASGTKEELIDLAKQCYKSVYVATKKAGTKVDDGWNQVQ